MAQIPLNDKGIEEFSEALDGMLAGIFQDVMEDLQKDMYLDSSVSVRLQQVGLFGNEAVATMVNDPFDVGAYEEAEDNLRMATGNLVKAMLITRLHGNALALGKEQVNETIEADRTDNGRDNSSGPVSGKPAEIGIDRPTTKVSSTVDGGSGGLPRGLDQEEGLPEFPAAANGRKA